MKISTLPGKSSPIGATIYSNGVNFSLFSKNAQGIALLLFDQADQSQPTHTIHLDPKINKTYHYWHIFVPNIGSGQIYAYRAYGNYAPEKGLRFDGSKILLDPYAQAIVGDEIYHRDAATLFGNDNCAQALKSVVVDTNIYDWEDDRHPRTPYASTVIYEMHVGGFTRHPSSGVAPEKRGTYAGLIEKIPYLKELGVTAVELLPIQYFDSQDVVQKSLENYWGYNTIGFFAPHNAYSSKKNPLGVVNEFRDMVKALHRAGIEVILDVVYNHTAEGNEQGATLSFRGLDNEVYYILELDNQANYRNYSGCGNSFRANHPVVGQLILNSLRYWVSEMHVDGFRFDLASVLDRDIYGQPMSRSPILWIMELDPALAGTKLIAEPWDASGLYNVGNFVNEGDWFAEWNGHFRDDVRRFVKGDKGTVSSLAARILSSSDIYTNLEREPNRSINFITCHDGFTLNDLVSYNYKHNEANAEENRDGSNDNWSWNCGEEGFTANPEVEAFRLRQIKNFWTILLLAQGTPMMLMGDEIRRTQQGNNNSYCQNNELSWFNWEATKTEIGLLLFVKSLIKFIQSLEIFQQERILSSYPNQEVPYIIWHGKELGKPDWSEDSHSLAFTLHHPQVHEQLHVMLNAYWQPLTFQLPALASARQWHRIVDTFLSSPKDFLNLATAVPITSENYLVQSRSSVVLMMK
jgi:glycogen operon protein